ncbi:MAG: ATP synthase F1 subunit gamma [Dictyoglomus sp.]|nr:ATP synthase F1 subunit gamma [Dictyoglomus sp.]MCX7845638.1 ATP synthase F1 subunit gamma [Dictyoglomaceae bacterium]MDW8189133.1 ATP synthase F1 subunit gamma [Dictyoglomus sp.]
MPTLQELRRKVKSIDNIGHIIRSMETLSIVKIRAFQDRALKLKPYTQELQRMLEILISRLPEEYLDHPLLKERYVYNTGVVFITSDWGFCGSYNIQVLNMVEKFTKDNPRKKMSFYPIGTYGLRFAKLKNLKIINSFTHLLDSPNFIQIRRLVRGIVRDFLDGKIDELYSISFDFINILKQEITIRRLLPLKPIDIPEKKEESFLFLPSSHKIIGPLLENILEITMFQIILDASASEQAFRRIAMRRAYENAEKIKEKLIFQLNQVRQTKITRELIEITSGIETLKEQEVIKIGG